MLKGETKEAEEAGLTVHSLRPIQEQPLIDQLPLTLLVSRSLSLPFDHVRHLGEISSRQIFKSFLPYFAHAVNLNVEQLLIPKRCKIIRSHPT